MVPLNDLGGGWELRTELVKSARDFVAYYDKHGAHLLGNGKAFQFYGNAKKLIGMPREEIVKQREEVETLRAALKEIASGSIVQGMSPALFATKVLND